MSETRGDDRMGTEQLPLEDDAGPGSGSVLDRSVSKVEITGFAARHYDVLMNLMSLGTYPSFIRRAVRDMGIRPQEHILILGSGTGRNACLMVPYLSGGRILGLDIGEEMLEQARRRCSHLPHVSFARQRVEIPLPYEEEFDRVFICLVLHGLVQEDRLAVVANAHRALRPGGIFSILDYDECNLQTVSWTRRFFFSHMECPLAADFVVRNWRTILAGQGFGDLHTWRYYRGIMRLLAARKTDPQTRGARNAEDGTPP